MIRILKTIAGLTFAAMGAVWAALMALQSVLGLATLREDAGTFRAALINLADRLSKADPLTGYVIAVGLIVVGVLLIFYHPTTHSPAKRALAAPTPPEPLSPFISVEDAGRWLYEHAGQHIRDTLRGGVPSPFDTIAAHGAAFVKEAAAASACKLYGRWEAGLPMEVIDASGADFTAFEAVFGTDRRTAVDLSILRTDLPTVLDYYQGDQPPQEPVRVVRDKSLREGLMFIVAGQWGLDPMADGGELLKGLSDALVEFRQRAHDGAVAVWGKANNHGVWQRIEPEYWVNHWVDLLDALKSDMATRAYNQLGQEPLYKELMVCRAEFEREWPRATRGVDRPGEKGSPGG